MNCRSRLASVIFRPIHTVDAGSQSGYDALCGPRRFGRTACRRIKKVLLPQILSAIIINYKWLT